MQRQRKVCKIVKQYESEISKRRIYLAKQGTVMEKVELVARVMQSGR